MLTLSEARSIKARQLYDFYRRKDGMPLKTLDECYQIANELISTASDLDFFNRHRKFDAGDGCVVWADGSVDPYREKYRIIMKTTKRLVREGDDSATNEESPFLEWAEKHSLTEAQMEHPSIEITVGEEDVNVE